jgi:hypothetical protein
MSQSLPSAASPPKAVDVPMTCPECKKHRSKLEFEFLPIDARCKHCIPDQDYYDLREECKLQAARNFAQIVDMANVAAPNAPSINEFLGHFYEEWGGGRMFVHDLAMQLKTAMQLRPGSDAVIKNLLAIAKLTHSASSLQQQEDLARMSDEQIRERNKINALAVLSEVVQDDAKGKLLAELLRANGLMPDPALIAEVQRG